MICTAYVVTFLARTSSHHWVFDADTLIEELSFNRVEVTSHPSTPLRVITIPVWSRKISPTDKTLIRNADFFSEKSCCKQNYFPARFAAILVRTCHLKDQLKPFRSEPFCSINLREFEKINWRIIFHKHILYSLATLTIVTMTCLHLRRGVSIHDPCYQSMTYAIKPDSTNRRNIYINRTLRR